VLFIVACLFFLLAYGLSRLKQFLLPGAFEIPAAMDSSFASVRGGEAREEGAVKGNVEWT
jgi:hypothetical protein